MLVWGIARNVLQVKSFFHQLHIIQFHTCSFILSLSSKVWIQPRKNLTITLYEFHLFKLFNRFIWTSIHPAHLSFWILGTIKGFHYYLTLSTVSEQQKTLFWRVFFSLELWNSKARFLLSKQPSETKISSNIP